MRTLTLLRHAKSTWHDPVARDFDRPLNKRGRLAAQAIGREMRNQDLAFDRIIASPAARVVQTIDDLADGYGAALPTSFDGRVYLASTATLLDIVHELADDDQAVLIVGHNPGLEALALLLTREDGDKLREQIAIKYPTATLAEISLPVESWTGVDRGIGKVSRFIRPRDLDPELGPDEDTH